MTEAKHTEGPWFHTATEDGDLTWIGTDGENVACVPGYSDHPLNIANARLIAAAPDMLAALQDCLEAEERRREALNTGSPAARYADSRLTKVRTAIAKATGAA